MKKMIVGCIDVIYEFDSINDFDKYINNIKFRHKYKVVKCLIRNDGTIRARIKRRYNDNSKFMEYDGDSYS